MPYLQCNIYSNFGGRQYGAAGDPVTKISDRGNVQIVEGKDGIRFSVPTVKLTEALTEIDSTNTAPELATVKPRNHGKTVKSSSIQTLF